MTSKIEFLTEIKHYSSENLGAILQSIDINPEDLSLKDLSPTEIQTALAERLTNTLWSSAHSPIGEVIRPSSLEDIASTIAELLDINVNVAADGWSMIDDICNSLLPADREIELDQVSEEHEEQLKKSLVGFFSGLGTLGSAYLSRVASLKIIQLLSTPLLPLLRLIPSIGPALITVKTAAGVILRLSGPVGIIAAIWSINSALGPDWEKSMRILLGVGLVRRSFSAHGLVKHQGV